MTKKEMQKKFDDIEYKVLYLLVRATQRRHLFPEFYNSVQELNKELQRFKKELRRI